MTDVINKPFTEQLAFFRDKIRLPTATWTDLWQGEHARAFVVAGAIKDDLLLDFQQAIDSSMMQGTGYKAFRANFDSIVKKHGWSYNGGAGWRSRVIYNTNMQTAYMAGRFKQMDSITHLNPYWQYKHSGFVLNPRKQHVAWSGMVLRHDDPWWRTHYPPNGWGCRCKVYSLGERGMERLGKTSVDKAPEMNYQDKLIGKRGPNPRIVKVPDGIDAGWDYNVGEASVGKKLSQEKWNEWNSVKNKGWKPKQSTDWKSYDRPQRLTATVSMLLGKRMKDAAEIEQYLIKEFNGAEKIFNAHGFPVKLNAAFLADHLKKDIDRTPYLPWLLESLQRPDEIWLLFEQHQGTGKYRLRTRFIKMVNKRDSDKAMTVVLDANKANMVGLTFIPKTRTSGINSGRKGRLMYAKD
ncbi:hypothetical protein JYT79_01730 [Cardiobacterium sp. AH-315-I02]|nr:hypothetical protein [Cardiobacterium sp. AH-315-I02]